MHECIRSKSAQAKKNFKVVARTYVTRTKQIGRQIFQNAAGRGLDQGKCNTG